MAAGYVFADPLLQMMWDAWWNVLIVEADWSLHLFDVDRTPADGDDETDYNEASFPGYVPIALDNSLWQNPTLAGHIVETVYDPPPQFNYTAGGSSPVTIYGYFLLDNADVFQFAERVAVPKTIDQGEGLKVTPRLRIKTCRG